MRKTHWPKSLFLAFLLLGLGLKPALGTGAEGDGNRSVRIDMWIGKDQKENKDKIETRLHVKNVRKVNIQIAQWGDSTQTAGIGSDVPVEIAQNSLKIQSELRGVSFLLAQFLVPPTYVTLGSSLYEEKVEIPVAQEDLRRLLDPNLDNREFHALYRSLTGEDKILENLKQEQGHSEINERD